MTGHGLNILIVNLPSAFCTNEEPETFLAEGPADILCLPY